MVLDTSAIIAIAFDEAERDIFRRLLFLESELATSAVTFYEASVVAVRKKQDRLAMRLIDAFMRELAIEVVPLALEGALAAREAYIRFGRGFHPAGLNMADCFSYSLAKSRKEPLLFKGEDFLKTDVVPAWRPELS